MLSVGQARTKVLASVAPMPLTSVRVADALGMVVGRDLFAPHALPRFDNSAMDGFAVRGADAESASEQDPVTLSIVGEVRAGSAEEVSVAAGEAVRIFTGAPLPQGADAVIPVEETSVSGDTLTCLAPTPARRHVRPAGDDLSEGDLLVSAGTELGPGELALLASMGCSPLEVHARPRVAILVTGDELIDPEGEPRSGQIRDSNSVALAALVREAGADVDLRPRVPDDLDATLEAFAAAGEDADLVVSSGGVAVGDYDFVKDVIEKLGRIDMWKVAMQPGKPVVLGSIGSTPFLGLPGNPVSIHVSFEQFVRPAIRLMRGCTQLLRPTVIARLTERITKRPGRLHFVRVRLDLDGSEFFASPTGAQGSHIQSSLIGCDGVAIFDAEAEVIEAGQQITVELWRMPSR